MIWRPGEGRRMERVRSRLLPLLIKLLVHPAILEGILEVQHFLPWNRTSELSCLKASVTYGAGVRRWLVLERGRITIWIKVGFIWSVFVTFQCVGHCDVDFFVFWVKKVEGKLLPEVVLQLMAGSTRIEMAVELVDGGGCFLCFYKILIEALCYGGVRKIKPGHSLESSPLLTSCKASPWHGCVQDESEKNHLKLFIILLEMKYVFSLHPISV